MRFLSQRVSSAVLASAIAGAGALGAAAPSASADELKLAHFMSPKHSMDRFVMRPWSEEIGKLSEGGLTVKIYPGGALGKGPVAQFKRAVDGVADITFGLPGFTSNLFPRTTIIELPAMASTPMEGAAMMWKAYPDYLAPEWQRVKLLALWTNDQQVLMTKNKPVRAVGDLKGMKIRVPSKVQAGNIKALGGTPVPMPINRVYNALNTGVIDGILSGPSTIISFKFNEVAKYYTSGLPWGRSPFFLAMNLRAWEGLSAKQKKLIDITTGPGFSTKAAEVYFKAGKRGLDSVRKSSKHEVIDLSSAEVKKGTEILTRHRAGLLAELEKKGVPANEILKSMGVAGG